MKDLYEKRINKMQNFAKEESKQKHANSMSREQLIKKRQEEQFNNLPPDDYRRLSVIPTIEEIKDSKKPFLRPLPENKSFKDSFDLLDCSFRLLKEDAVRPLREGQTLMKILSNQNNFKTLRKALRESGVRLFDRVTIIDYHLAKECKSVALKIRISEKEGRQNWLVNKKLLTGSLISLSNDGFKTITLCKVVERDNVQMNKTSKKFKFVEIGVEVLASDIIGFKEQERNFNFPIIPFFQQNQDYSFTMIESTAYFESYQHVLRKLQEMGQWEDFPLIEYLKGAKKRVSALPLYYEEKQLEHNIDAIINQVAQTSNFDQSQRQAFYSCLQKEVALIQGPPGTGKTYVGEKVVQALLKFKKAWREHGPILMVCYTNHALDQFLGLVSKETKKYLRIGGGSKDPELQNHTIRTFLKINGIKYSQGFYNTLDSLKRMIQKFDNDQIKKIMDSFAIINNHSSDMYAKQTLEQIKSNFWFKIKNEIKIIQPKVQKQVMEYINAMFQNFDDVVILFWLDIVNISRYLENLEFRAINGQIYNEELDENDLSNGDDINQRELDDSDIDDYQKEMLMKRKVDSFSKKLDYFKELYDYNYQGEIFRDCTDFDSCLKAGQSFGSKYTLYQGNLFDLSIKQRWQLNNFLCPQQKKELIQEELLIEKFIALQKRKRELEELTQLEAFKLVDIVAMTTTGAAKYNDLLKQVGFPIVIVEEAAEVFEAHILTAINEKTQHLILIGDHQQLRPTPAVYELEKDYNLNVSMFERLVKGGIDYVTLSSQRRMRPEISAIIRYLYPQLRDDGKVLTYPHIRGIDKDVFFFDHQKMEANDEGLMSKKNIFEAEMITQLTDYLIKQLYKPKQITVLSLYQAQSLTIKKMFAQQFNKEHPIQEVKVITVDNFQGEENDIILLSLVRSNLENNIGYLKISNRVCVALSRAKQGMFIFGNSECLMNYKACDDQTKLWKNILMYLKDKDFIGKELQLKCTNHKNVTVIKEPKDFSKVPEGGCKLPCESRLPCGHKCESLCHYIEISEKDPTGHKIQKCTKKCPRVLACGHQCQNKCYECQNGCQQCKIAIEKIFPICNHKTQIYCYQKNMVLECQTECRRKLQCGHLCKKKCYQPCSIHDCKEQIPITLDCGHQIEVDCCDKNNYLGKDRYKCFHPCATLLQCCHPCPSKCWECNQNFFHSVCDQKCGRLLVCGHECKEKCSKECIQCKEKCETACAHSKCPQECSDVCQRCEEACKNKCPHSKCTRKCYQPCNKQLCYEPCQMQLECGHQCIGLCGDECPKICRTCDPKNENFEIFFGTEDKENARFVQIDCGHIFEVESLDQWMKTGENDESHAVSFKECPKCKSSIKKTTRYQTQINETFFSINEIKKKMKQNFQIISQKKQELLSQFTTMKEAKMFFVQSQDLNLMREWENKFKKINANTNEIKIFAKYLQLIKFVRSLRKFSEQKDNIGILSSFFKMSDQTLKLQALNFVQYIIGRKFMVDEQKFKEIEAFVNKVDKDFDLDEIRIIASALNMGPGRWFKCQNGHFYTIGECGGAMQESKCPDCGCVIGGSNHSLAAGNQHAGEIDRSQRPAWDPQGFDQQVLDGRINLQNIIRH